MTAHTARRLPHHRSHARTHHIAAYFYHGGSTPHAGCARAFSTACLFHRALGAPPHPRFPIIGLYTAALLISRLPGRAAFAHYLRGSTMGHARTATQDIYRQHACCCLYPHNSSAFAFTILPCSIFTRHTTACLPVTVPLTGYLRGPDLVIYGLPLFPTHITASLSTPRHPTPFSTQDGTYVAPYVARLH